MKTISAEAYLAFDGTKFFDRDACREYEQDEVLKPVAIDLARKLANAAMLRGGYGADWQPTETEIRRFLRENRRKLLEILRGITP